MLRMLHRLYLRGLKSAGKVQRRQTRALLTTLFATPLARPKAPTKRLLSPNAKRHSSKPKTAKLEPPKTGKPTRQNAGLKNTPRKSRAPHEAGAAPRARRSAATPEPARSPGAAAPGKWLLSYYSSLADGGALPGRHMAYYLYLPPEPHVLREQQEIPANTPQSTTARTGVLRPLLVMLHGCEQTATQFAQGTRMNHLAEKKGWAVLYPQQSLQSHPTRCWKWYDNATQHGGGDVDLIVGIIEKVAASEQIDRSRIYLCGISAGAAMAHIVALNHPHLIAAIGLHSAPMFGAGRSPLGAYHVMQQGDQQRVQSAIAEVLARTPRFPLLPTILIQGQSDTVVRPINQIQLEQQVLLLHRTAIDRRAPAIDKPAGAVSRRRRAHAYSVRDFYQKNKPLLRVVEIAGLPHCWSGGDAALPFNSGVGPDASKLMLAFFTRHRRLALAAALPEKMAAKARA